MSRVPLESINASRINTGTYSLPATIFPVLTRCAPCIGDDQDPLHSVQNHAASHGVPDYVDGSGPIFSMYLERAEEEDKKMVEDWKADADGILIFVRLHFQNPYFIHATRRS
jgi:hypothetical protein